MSYSRAKAKPASVCIAGAAFERPLEDGAEALFPDDDGLPNRALLVEGWHTQISRRRNPLRLRESKMSGRFSGHQNYGVEAERTKRRANFLSVYGIH